VCSRGQVKAGSRHEFDVERARAFQAAVMHWNENDKSQRERIEV
jgi:hypothetical protein